MPGSPPRPTLLALTALVAGCAASRPAPPRDEPPAPLGAPWAARYDADHPLAGRIWSVERAEFVPPDTLLRALADTPVVLLGERHDHPDHHRLQAHLVDALLAGGTHATVGFEMLDAGDAAALSALSEPKPAAVAEAVGWARSGWPPFALYQPIFAAIDLRGGAILPAHPPAARVEAVMGGGFEALPADERRALELAPLPEPLRAGLIEALRAGHCGHLPPEMAEPMLRAQRLKDAWMADRLAGAARGGVILVAGAGHVRRDWGVPLYLAREGIGRSAAVAFVEVDAGADAPSDYGALPYDFVWFTPRVDDVDPCARFRERLERLRRRQ